MLEGFRVLEKHEPRDRTDSKWMRERVKSALGWGKFGAFHGGRLAFLESGGKRGGEKNSDGMR